jgi:hypothetical protein
MESALTHPAIDRRGGTSVGDEPSSIDDAVPAGRQVRDPARHRGR